MMVMMMMMMMVVNTVSADAVQSEDMNDEVMEDNVVMSTQITQTQSSPADTTRRLYGSSVYSETSFGSASLMSERVVRSPLHCGSHFSHSLIHHHHHHHHRISCRRVMIMMMMMITEDIYHLQRRSDVVLFSAECVCLKPLLLVRFDYCHTVVMNTCIYDAFGKGAYVRAHDDLKTAADSGFLLGSYVDRRKWTRLHVKVTDQGQGHFPEG